MVTNKKLFVFVNAPGEPHSVVGIFDRDDASHALSLLNEGNGYFEAREGEWETGKLPAFYETTSVSALQLDRECDMNVRVSWENSRMQG